MVYPNEFLSELKKRGIGFFAGVPDSLMKGFLSCLEDDKNHVITANEGAAIAMAAGYHLATGQTALVYVQNSGLGNLINPLTSLVNKEVYCIPILLLVGWRGRPGIKDEPQHKKMGEITPLLLETLGLPFFVLKKNPAVGWQEVLDKAIKTAHTESQPAALLVEEGFFEDLQIHDEHTYELSAVDVMELMFPYLSEDAVIILNTGKLGRLFYKCNQEKGGKIKMCFMNVGAMGHAGSIGAAIAKYSRRRVVIMDGDGSLLMHMGSLAVIGQMKLTNLSYLLFNNGAHQSVGGQKTVGFQTDFCSIAKASGFQHIARITSKLDLQEWLAHGFRQPEFIEIRINTDMPLELPRPQAAFNESKDDFMNELNRRK